MIQLSTPKNSRQVIPKSKTTVFVTTTGTVYTNNLTTGAFEQATGSTVEGQALYIANETIAAADNRSNVNVTVMSTEDRFLVDTVNAANVAHNGQRMLLDATGAKANNTGTDAPTGVLIQVDTAGTNKIIALKA